LPDFKEQELLFGLVIFFRKVMEMPKGNRKGNKADSIEKEKRIHEVSLMLRRKSISYIVKYIKENWNLEYVQAYNYIKEAREEWKKYFMNIKRAGISYHVAQIRDLKDKILEKKTLSKDDYRLILDVFREESKLMDAYPKEKVEHSGEVKVDLNLEGMEIEEIRKLIRALEDNTRTESKNRTEEEGDKKESI